MERFFPEKRLFLRSDTDVRFIRLKPSHQLAAFVAGTFVVAWSIIATAILLMDSIGSGNFREQARRDQQTYELRLNEMATDRDRRTEEALAAQARFNAALIQISVMQSELLASETRRHELETGIEVTQTSLRRIMGERDEALADVEALRSENAQVENLLAATRLSTAMEDTLADALAETAQERDEMVAGTQEALTYVEDMELEIALMEERNDKIFRQIEDAMTVSVEPLTKMFTAAGLDTETLLNQVRRGYAGQGGPMTPISFSTSGGDLTLDTQRTNALLGQLDELNLYRIAAETAPFDFPIKTAYRFTSGFGARWGRAHKGVDFAGKHGSPIYATADGVVIHADWLSGYGRLVKIKHDYGIETRYAHMAKIRVKVGDRVSRGTRIGDMGNSGRSTGTHLHYEVRVNGRAVNPMTFIKAGQNVF